MFLISTLGVKLEGQIVIPQPGLISTGAGKTPTTYSGDMGAATSAELYDPTGVAVDSAHNLYIADSANNRIRKVTASSGIITTIAGNGVAGYSGDGSAALAASLDDPTGVALDSAGNLYIADQANNRIRKVTATTGIITTVAGNGTYGYSGDRGLAIGATLALPNSIAIDASGNLFIADEYNHCIRKVTTSSGVITTVAGNGSGGFSGDGGPALTAELFYPEGVAVDASGNFYIADYQNNRIRKVTSTTGTITTVANLPYPTGVALDSAGNLYFSDQANSNSINKLTLSTGNITLVAGNGVKGYFGDGGTAVNAELSSPAAVAVDSANNVYIADASNNRIRQVAASTSLISTIAGNGTSTAAGDGGAATNAELYYPNGVAVDSAGNLYIADQQNNRIRKVTATTDTITTLAGNGNRAFAGDGGAAISASLNAPSAISLDAAGNLYIADQGNSRIRKVTASTGIIATVAGSGGGGYGGDGIPAIYAEFYSPSGVAVDTTGNLYIADTSNNRIRKVTASTGIVSTLAGNGTAGFSGDYGPAASAELSYPMGVAVDSAGNVYIADTGNNRIRKIAALTGIITTFAGTGGPDTGDGNPATMSGVSSPSSVALDNVGNLYITENGNRVRKVTASSGIISTIAGDGIQGYAGDGGAATSAELYYPGGAAVDLKGDLFIADTRNDRVRIVSPIKGTATLTWTQPAAVIYGTVLSATQLNATATASGVMGNLPGTYTYSPALGALLAAGTNTLSVTFTPADTVDFVSMTKTVQLIVTKATPIVTATVVSTAVPFGTRETVNVQVSCNSACGSVDYKINGSEWGTVALNSSGFYSAVRAAGDAAGTYSVNISFLGSANYTTANGLVTFFVTQVSPTVTWPVPAAIVYGTALSATQLNAVASGVAGSLPGTFTYSPAVGSVPVAGTDTLSVTFTPTDATDYLSMTKTVPLAVGKATPTVLATVLSSSVPYGTPATVNVQVGCRSACGSVDYKINGNEWGTVALNSSGAFSAARPAGDALGTYSVIITYLGNANYNSAASNTITFVVTQAAPLITWAPPTAIVYGTSLSATQLDATATGVAGALPGTFAYSPAAGTLLNSGTQTLSVTFTPTDATHYTVASKAVSLAVNKATPVITWTAPSGITYGTPLSAVQLNANASGLSGVLPGTFAYLPASGTVPSAGTDTLSTTFTPASGANYATATKSVSLPVSKAAPQNSWPTPTAITSGMALSAVQLDAIFKGVNNSVLTGVATYNPAAGTVPALGIHTLSVSFVPADAVDYATASASVQLVVNQMPTPVVSLTAAVEGTAPSYGQLLTLTAGLASTSQTALTGSISFMDGSMLLGTVSLPMTTLYTALGPGTHSLTASYSGDGNFNPSATVTPVTQSVNTPITPCQTQ